MIDWLSHIKAQDVDRLESKVDRLDAAYADFGLQISPAKTVAMAQANVTPPTSYTMLHRIAAQRFEPMSNMESMRHGRTSKVQTF